MSTTLQPAKLLSFALLADAATSGLSGVLLASAAGALGPILGLPVELLRFAGLLFLPWAALLAYAGTRRNPPKALVWLIIVFNAIWVVESVMAIALGWLQPTTLGLAFVLAQAAAVGVLAELQFIGLRRSAPSGEAAAQA
jgi:hypothetical protein